MECTLRKAMEDESMDNNDILIRLRYALDIKDTQMVEIFKLGGIDLTEEKVKKLLIKTRDPQEYRWDDEPKEEENIPCDYQTLDSFLNGFIIFKRGRQEEKPGQAQSVAVSVANSRNMNNILLKKLKIALSLTGEEMLDILQSAGVVITKGELGAVFRREGHKHYKECGDRYARNFLKGLAIKNRA